MLLSNSIGPWCWNLTVFAWKKILQGSQEILSLWIILPQNGPWMPPVVALDYLHGFQCKETVYCLITTKWIRSELQCPLTSVLQSCICTSLLSFFFFLAGLLSTSTPSLLFFPMCLPAPSDTLGLGVFLCLLGLREENWLLLASANGVAVSMDDRLDRFPGDCFSVGGTGGDRFPEGGMFWFLVGRTAEICLGMTGVDKGLPRSIWVCKTRRINI